MSNPKRRHPADESFDSPPKAGTISNDADILPVRVDPPVSDSRVEETPKHGGTDRIPAHDGNDPGKPSGPLKGSNVDRTGESDAPAPKPEEVDDHRHERGM